MRRLPTALLLFLVFQGLYGVTASGRVDRVYDELEVYLQVEGLWERGSQALPRGLDPWFGRVGRGEAHYAPYGPGIAFTALPHHAVGRAVAAAAGVPREPRGAWAEVVRAVTSLSTATWAALAVAGCYAAGRALGAPRGRALLPAVLLGAATLLWPYGTFFYSEAVSAALLVWVVCFHLRGWTLPAALTLGALLLVKATNVVWVPALLLLALGSSGRAARRALAAYLLATAAAGLVHAEWNTHRFGDPFELGYDWSELLVPGAPPDAFRASDLPRGLVGLLLSPGKSLLVYAPPLLLVAARPRALRRFARERPGVAACAGVALGAGLAFYGSYMYWEGGYSFGPRHLVPLLPLLLLPLAHGPAPRRGAFVGLLGVGAAVQVLGVSVSFLEDQALGARAHQGEAREVYYRLVDDAPPGRPRNVYRLDYCPFATYPPRLWRHLRRPAPTPGEGLDYLRARLDRVRRGRPGGEAIPPWLPPLFPLGSLGVLGLGLAGLHARRGSSPPSRRAARGGC